MHIATSYSISEDKRRIKMHKILKSYGQWMQYNVFECELGGSQNPQIPFRD